MTHHWDEFSKSLSESVPRRESLRRLGFVFAGAVLSPLGLGTALAGRQDPCKSFCRCRRKSDQNQCLAACRACRDAGRTLLGSCGNYYCCGAGQTSCDGSCVDLANDPYNCGACGYICDQYGPYEYGACIEGGCDYFCVDGADRCDGQSCTYLGWDPYNCGACGNVCPGSAPYCNEGECVCPSGGVDCDGSCTFLGWDHYNCGACGNVCPGSAPYCNQGVCICPSGMAVCDGECINILNDPDNCGACGTVCPSSAPYCKAGVCVEQLCAPGLTWCHYGCANLSSDANNCGACGRRCGSAESCSSGSCTGICVGCEF